MKKYTVLIFIFFLFVSTGAQTIPPVGTIEIYGLRNVSEAKVREALQIREGDAGNESRADIEKRLSSLPGVEQVSVSFICCDDLAHQRIIYVGIREKGTAAVAYHSAPSGTVRLPTEIIKVGDELDKAAREAVLKNDATEDESQGHALFNNGAARQLQMQFIAYANQNLKLLRRVLRESNDADHRALATEIIAYYKDKRAVIDDLVYAAADPDSGVRNNSMRALGVIAQFAIDAKRADLKIPYKPFVKMLNSVNWSDRNKSAWLMSRLVYDGNAKLLAALRREALDSLIGMARWKNPGHAALPFIILARLLGYSDEESFQMWQQGDRETVIAKAKGKVKSEK